MNKDKLLKIDQKLEKLLLNFEDSIFYFFKNNNTGINPYDYFFENTFRHWKEKNNESKIFILNEIKKRGNK